MRPLAATVATPPFAHRSGRALRAIVIAGLATSITAVGTRARADDEPDAAEPEQAEIYRRVALPPFFERRIQSILQEEWQQAQENAQKVGLRRMSRRHFRRSLIALDRSTDAKIRKLIGAKKFAAWKRARTDYARTTGGDGAAAGAAAIRWLPDRCAGLGRTLRGAELATATAEEAYVWIHSHARHC
jgi:hypothetical protein